MARTRTISDERILDAAREVFLEQGLEGTTVEIAKRAKISEGTIFKRFETKEQLFLAAMAIELPVWLKRSWAEAGVHPLRESLRMVCEALIEFFKEMIPRMTMIMAKSGKTPKEMFGPDEAPPLRAIKALSIYLRQEQRLGRLGDRDVEILARMIISACHHYAFIEFIGTNSAFQIEQARYIEGVLDYLFEPLVTSKEQEL